MSSSVAYQFMTWNLKFPSVVLNSKFEIEVLS